jgi:apolipoprotein D and lipocalin family protein
LARQQASTITVARIVPRNDLALAFLNRHASVMTRALILSLAPLLLTACATQLPPPTTVASVDLARYAGAWHEIESFPNWFQSGCAGTKANYTPQADGTIKVVNTCERRGQASSIEGTARVVPGSNNSKLKVRFFGPFEGDYWILDLDPDYRWAAVGAPNRRYLWILSRNPQIDPALLGRIRARLAAQGFDVSRLRPTAPSP